MANQNPSTSTSFFGSLFNRQQAPKANPDDNLFCAFCGAARANVFQLVKGERENACICDRCVSLSHAVLAEQNTVKVHAPREDFSWEGFAPLETAGDAVAQKLEELLALIAVVLPGSQARGLWLMPGGELAVHVIDVDHKHVVASRLALSWIDGTPTTYRAP